MELHIEYRVRPVTRYIVTRFEEGANRHGAEERGEFPNFEMAYAVGYALAKQEHERLGYPLGDERVRYPEPHQGGANAVQVTAADFNGEDFDGSPFSSRPDWLVAALESGKITLHPSDRDYALWRLNNPDYGPKSEPRAIAEPGDWIVRAPNDEIVVLHDAAFRALVR